MRLSILLLAAMCAAPEAMENVGGKWWIQRERVIIEAGREPRSLHRDTVGGRIEIDDAIEKVLFVEPDCVVYQTARVAHRVFAVCGDRTPVAIASSSALQWQFGADGLRRTGDDFTEVVPMRDIIDLAMRQPPFRRDWNANAEPSLEPVREAVRPDPNAVRPDGNTPLIHAVVRGRADLVDSLLAAGADPNGRAASSGATALMISAGRGNLAFVERLVAAKADPNLRDKEGATALMYAAGVGETAVARRLLAAGADRSIRDDAGRTAHDLASNEELRALLKP